MKFKNLLQSVRCPSCRLNFQLKELRRAMNFTFGDIVFICRCQRKLGQMHFTEWNQLQREFYTNPPALPESRSKANLPRSREGEKSREGRSPRTRNGNRRRRNFRGKNNNNPSTEKTQGQ